MQSEAGETRGTETRRRRGVRNLSHPGFMLEPSTNDVNCQQAEEFDGRLWVIQRLLRGATWNAPAWRRHCC